MKSENCKKKQALEINLIPKAVLNINCWSVDVIEMSVQMLKKYEKELKEFQEWIEIQPRLPRTIGNLC